MSEITIEKIGPIDKLTIPIPEEGGVVVLQGRNGKGKSIGLSAAESLLSEKGGLVAKDKSIRGEVAGLGAKITVGRSTRRSGELEAITLEGRFAVAELVDPGLKAHDAADAKRIKALVHLQGIKADPALFYDLVGGKEQFDKLILPADVAGDDLVIMATKIKSRLEEHARLEEGKADQCVMNVKAHRSAAMGYEDQMMTPAEPLNSALEDAIRSEERIKTDAQARDHVLSTAAHASELLKKAADEYSGPMLADAKETLALASTKATAASDEVARLTTLLNDAKVALTAAVAYEAQSKAARDTAAGHFGMIAAWEESIKAGKATIRISDADVDAAIEAVETARNAVKIATERNALIVRSKNELAIATQLEVEEKAHRTGGDLLREAAKSTDEVLSTVVSQTSALLKVQSGRLVLETVRGETYFAELSEGERWKIALDIAIEAVGSHGIIVIPQHCWESLDPTARKLIAEHVKGRGVVILTAEATDDDGVVAREFTT